ncbi:MAG: serine hydrolase domain-containing protein [Promethearchaeota archaeon]
MILDITDEFITKIEKLIAYEMTKLKVGGLSYAIITDKEVLYSNGIGAKDLDKNLPADLNTIYNVASLSKSFVCTAIMILVDQGKLSIEDPANKYIPLKIGDPENPITIKHLMNHTSGMPDLGSESWTYRMLSKDLKPGKSAKFTPLSSKSDFYRLMNNGVEYCHTIDQFFHYNNYGYTMLGHIIEEVGGVDSFTEFIKNHIFTPLKMDHSSFNPDDFKENKDLTVGYFNFPEKEGGKTSDIGRWHDRWEFLAAGGLYTSVKDLVNYMQMHMSLGSWNGIQILTEKSANLMQRDSLLPDTMAKKYHNLNSWGKSLGYGFGFFVNDNFYGTKGVGHGGNMLGGTADFRFLPNLNVGIISLANNFIGPRPIITSILAMLMGVEDSKNHYLEERKHFKSLNGIYENYSEAERIKITGEVAQLTISPVEKTTFSEPPMSFLPLENDHLNPMEFYSRLPGGAKFLIFFENLNGQLWLNFERIRYKRIGPL